MKMSKSTHHCFDGNCRLCRLVLVHLIKTDSSSSSKETANSSTEVVSGASISAKPEELEMALSDKGNWIVATTDNVTFDNEVTVRYFP